MANMSYCRFQNTASDLADCQEALEQAIQGGGDEKVEPLSRRELDAAKRLVQTCKEILELVAETAGEDLDLDGIDHESVLADMNQELGEFCEARRHA